MELFDKALLIRSNFRIFKKPIISETPELNMKNIGIIGLSFKAGTDDLRYSPSVEIIENLIGKGYKIKIWDTIVNESKLVGSNKKYISDHLPHISELITDNLDEVIDKSEVIFITQKFDNAHDIIEANKDKIFIDVVRIIDKSSHKNYLGICW